MADYELEQLLETVRNGSTFESLRAAKCVAELKRSRKILEQSQMVIPAEKPRRNERFGELLKTFKATRADKPKDDVK